MRKNTATRGDEFGVVAQEWLDGCALRLKRSSVAKYRQIVEQYLKPTFGKRPIQTLTRSEIQDFVGTLVNADGRRTKALAPKTVNSILAVLSGVLKYARNEKGVDAIHYVVGTVKNSKSERPTLSRAERRKLIGYLRGDLTPCHLGILLSLLCGLRIGEICALRWGDVSFENGRLNVTRTMQRAPRLDQRRGRKTEIIESTPKSAA